MKKVAVIQFPGTNSEYETRRALREAQIDGKFFRWNQDPKELDSFDGFVLCGGFAYEDRGRAGLIASMDSIMVEIRNQAAKGKPVLGICNGAQALVETGLIPGGADGALLMCLARNKRVRAGELLGTGFYNEDVYIKCEAPQRTAFTLDYETTTAPELVPVAHGEGRFTTTIPTLFDKLRENSQIVFRYCDQIGTVDSDFPVNPNGATDNAAAICNPSGNVMAIMPHPERAFIIPMPKIFSSMRKYMEGAPLQNTKSPLEFTDNRPPLQNYKPSALQIFVELKITDNEAQTIQNALNHKGFNVKLKRWIHYEISHNSSAADVFAELAKSGELWNSNKENATTSIPKIPSAKYFLARDMEDSAGTSKTARLQRHLGKDKIQNISQGTFWQVETDSDIEKILATNIFDNHHAQVLWEV
ncbi:phosphoribosylformylglycinamidine synthase I [Candidatus Peregrinibacteria bacterium]|nr:phosphoribosylformylglycinamidine synthase I [Candidatus Peregrinibacteria bacterium]